MAAGPSASQRIVLALRDGEVTDAAGRATVVLAERIGHRRDPSGLRVLTAALARAERAGLIERDVKGRRTFRIRLADNGSTRAATPPMAPVAPLAGLPGDGMLDDLADRIVAAGVRRWNEADGLRRQLQTATQTNEALSAKLTGAAAKIRKLQAENRRLRKAAATTADQTPSRRRRRSAGRSTTRR
jgi:hypothetical protein